MASVSKQEVLDNVRREVGRIAADPFAGTDYRSFEPAPDDIRLLNQKAPAEPEERPPFATWLLDQGDRSEALFLLVQSAKRDPQFPRKGDVDAVRARLSACGAEGDLFEALDDAELDWACL